MQIAQLTIENFRGIDEPLPLDFTDGLGRVRELTLLVGPNGSGKTSILDAIWFGLQAEIGYPNLRRNFRTEPRYVVTTGHRFAWVGYEIRISKEENDLINRWKAELVEAGAIGEFSPRDQMKAHLEWTYPAQPGYEEKPFGAGGYRYTGTGFDWYVLRGRDYARRMRKISAAHVEGIDRIGGIFFFEQERQIVAEPVRSLPTGDYEPDNGKEPGGNIDQPPDIRSMLIDFGVREQLGRIPPEQSWYRRIRESFDYICAPRKMGKVFVDQADDEYEIDFEDGQGRHYSFDGLSSGERAVLNFLVQYFAKRMRNSLVLIDELELHLHPTWQRRVLQNFLRLDDGNQLIIATHSPALRQAVPSDNTIELGELDVPDWQIADADAETE